jgi:RNA polymerase sigma factor (sigma-70 family)
MFAEQGASLVRLARVFCDDRDAAEDLVQEAFIRLHRSAGSIRDLGRAPAFLRSIVINLARDHNRRGLMSLRHRSSTDLPEPPMGPDERAVRGGEVDQVLLALRLLPERQRACLVLHYYEELSIGEVAETLRISPNSVKTHCRRGLAALEARLEDTT